VPLWFKASRPSPTASTPAGHEVDRSVSRLRPAATPLHVTASRLTAAPLLPHMSSRRAVG
jgi:hypothetical protein